MIVTITISNDDRNDDWKKRLRENKVHGIQVEVEDDTDSMTMTQTSD